MRATDGDDDDNSITRLNNSINNDKHTHKQTNNQQRVGIDEGGHEHSTKGEEVEPGPKDLARMSAQTQCQATNVH